MLDLIEERPPKTSSKPREWDSGETFVTLPSALQSVLYQGPADMETWNLCLLGTQVVQITSETKIM